MTVHELKDGSEEWRKVALDSGEAWKIRNDLVSALDMAKQSKQKLAYCITNVDAVWKGSDVGRVKELLEQYERAYDSMAADIESEIQKLMAVLKAWDQALYPQGHGSPTPTPVETKEERIRKQVELMYGSRDDLMHHSYVH